MDLEEDEGEENSFKIVLIGESGVGKTSIISQFVSKTFQEDVQASTGGAFCSKTLFLSNGKELKFDIWDTAGQERYRSLTKLFYKDTNAAILVYDITREDSFEQLQTYWIKQIREFSGKDIITVIVANKSDLIEEEKVDESIARKLANEVGAIFCLVSAKNCIGIDEIFFQIAKKHIGRDDITIKLGNDKEEQLGNDDEEENGKNDRKKITKDKSFSKNNNKRRCC